MKNLTDIINTNCYVQFDTNEQLREWVANRGIELSLNIWDGDTYIHFFESGAPDPVDYAHKSKPIYHHTQII
jgi:hypothetical protein